MPPQHANPSTRVYIDMVADMLHIGHVNLIRAARKLAEAEGGGLTLIVGIHSDKTVASYKRKPIIPMDQRVAMVSELRCVDQVIPNAPLTLTQQYLDEYRIDLVVHGDDISQANAYMMYSVPMEMGIYRQCSYTKGVSTTELIQRVQARLLEPTDNGRVGKLCK
jgi:cytidyltransferase-like protein